MDKIIDKLGNHKEAKLRFIFLAVAIAIVTLSVAITSKANTKPIEETPEQIVETTTEVTTEAKTEIDESIIVLDATSVDKDIRIRFYKLDWTLHTGIKFEVDVRDSTGKETHYVDEDMDGRIDIENATAGNATVTMQSVEGYSYQNNPTIVNVKAQVEYKPIKHIEAEVVHDGQEDSKKQEESVILKDTVEYVASTKKEIKNYFLVKIANVVEPTETTTEEKTTVNVGTNTVTENTTVESTTSESTTLNIPIDEATTKEKVALKDTSGNELYIKSGNDYVKAYESDYKSDGEFYRLVITYEYTGWQNINGKMYYYDKNGNFVTGSQVIQGVQYTFSTTGARGGTIGIDVSVYQGNIDWEKVKKSGIDFAIIRVGYRGYGSEGAMRADDTFDQNIQGAIAAGIKVGVYYFSQAITEAEAVEEASYCISKVAQYKLSLPIFIDTESAGGMYNGSWYEGRANSMTAEQRTKVCLAFCKTIKNAGYKAGIYANKTYFTKKLNASEFSSYTIWLAEWVDADAPTYTGKYDIWQKSSSGIVDGISGRVDMNYA